MSDGEGFKKQVRKSTFGKNLTKALKERAAEKEAAPPPKKPGPGRDSFAGRLADKIKAANAKATPVPTDGAAPPQSNVDGQPQGPTDPASAGPAGTGEHIVKQGECIASIAKDSGHFWKTIWDDAANTELREARQDPYVLLPADRVHVPPLREKWESRQTEARHRFRRKGWPEKLQFRILRNGEPRGNQPYTIDVDGKLFSGTTTPDGSLSCPIIPNARRAILRVGVDPDVTQDVFLLGGIDPIDQISGIQGRLNNLGFDCGAVDGVCGPRTQTALSDYQRSRSLETTGMPDDATRRQLKSDYGS